MSSPSSDVIKLLYGKKAEVILVGEDENGAEVTRSVKILRVTMRDLGDILGIANKFFQELGMDTNGKVTINLADSGTIMQLISKLPKEVNIVLAMLTSLEPSQVQELELDHGFELFSKVIEVNKDFFIQKVKPKLDAILAAAGTKLTQKTSL